MVAHFICLLYTGFVVYTSSPGSSLFSWHPTLMALCFTFLMVQGLLIFSPQSSLFTGATRKTKTTCHWVLMLVALVTGGLGFLAIYTNKENHGKPHFTSWHSWLGAATLVCCATQCCGGANLLHVKSYAKFQTVSSWRLVHATSGLLLFVLAAFSLVTGMFTNWFAAVVTGTSWYACVSCPLVLLSIVATQVKNAFLSTKDNSSKPSSVQN